MLWVPINLARRLLCPACGMLTNEKKPKCVHCGYRFRKGEREQLVRARKRKKKNVAVIAAVVFMALIFLFSRLAP